MPHCYFSLAAVEFPHCGFLLATTVLGGKICVDAGLLQFVVFSLMNKNNQLTYLIISGAGNNTTLQLWQCWSGLRIF